MRICSLFAIVVAAAAVAAGCGGTNGTRTRATQPPVHRRVCRPAYHAYRNDRVAWAAIVREHTVARRRPGGGALAAFGKRNVNGVPTVFSIRGARVDKSCAPVWYLVQLPIRPNGTTGWVRAADVTVASVRTRIDVDLSARRLTLFRSGRPVLTATVAIGSDATPTPTGRFYVNQRLVPDDPSGPYGPGAVGVSAFSNVLTGWTQGGPIAIHGTDEPSSIGHAVSNGCIRLPNAILKRVFAQALAGTPVTIHA